MAGTVLGTVLAAHGAVTDTAVTYRLGMLVVLLGVAGVLDARIGAKTRRLIEHQISVAKIGAQERQQWAEMGWKAAELSAAPAQSDRGGKIVDMPTRRAHEMRRDGSA